MGPHLCHWQSEHRGLFTTSGILRQRESRTGRDAKIRRGGRFPFLLVGLFDSK